MTVTFHNFLLTKTSEPLDRYSQYICGLVGELIKQTDPNSRLVVRNKASNAYYLGVIDIAIECEGYLFRFDVSFPGHKNKSFYNKAKVIAEAISYYY